MDGDDVRLARAGWGIAEVRVVGRFEARAWGPYPGVIQCIDAAEVFSAIMAMRLGAPPLHLYSDSSFFVTGWQRGRSWCLSPGRAHADVWREFWMVLDDFGGVAVLAVTKVRAHATKAMVEAGEVSAIDKWGNDQADEAAKKGAQCHPCIQALLEKRRVSRRTSQVCIEWLGVGLEAAQKAGALPEALTATQKAARPRQGQQKGLVVVPDETWGG